MRARARLIVRGDGDGWVDGPDGARRWGRHGAAGLLLRAPGPVVLMQHRALWSHHGGTWSLPGGARDSHESPTEAALREAHEEAGVPPGRVAVRAERITAAIGAWSYTTVVADTAHRPATTPDAESTELRWVAEDDVERLDLHPGLRLSWPALRARPVRLLLDAANVVGSRPDGWWRDRAGATRRLLGALAAVLPRTVVLPDGSFAWVAGLEAVVEGAAGDLVVDGAVDGMVDGVVDGVRIYRAPGSGDDELVRVAAPDHLVVTADRGLRARVSQQTSIGPGEVLRWLPSPGRVDRNRNTV